MQIRLLLGLSLFALPAYAQYHCPYLETAKQNCAGTLSQAGQQGNSSAAATAASPGVAGAMQAQQIGAMQGQLSQALGSCSAEKKKCEDSCVFDDTGEPIFSFNYCADNPGGLANVRPLTKNTGAKHGETICEEINKTTEAGQQGLNDLNKASAQTQSSVSASTGGDPSAMSGLMGVAAAALAAGQATSAQPGAGASNNTAAKGMSASVGGNTGLSATPLSPNKGIDSLRPSFNDGNLPGSSSVNGSTVAHGPRGRDTLSGSATSEGAGTDHRQPGGTAGSVSGTSGRGGGSDTIRGSTTVNSSTSNSSSNSSDHIKAGFQNGDEPSGYKAQSAGAADGGGGFSGYSHSDGGSYDRGSTTIKPFQTTMASRKPASHLLPVRSGASIGGNSVAAQYGPSAFAILTATYRNLCRTGRAKHCH